MGDEAPARNLQAVALFSLAVALQNSPEEEQRKDSLAILKGVAKQYADVELQSEKMADLVEPMIYQLQFLSLGCTPPDIVGSDQNGEQMRLSDYRGKVVMLDFWADWCPHCRNMYPLERKLVEDRADQPFALVGVNCDEPARLKRVLDSGAITWRNWADGPQGPISRQWRVEGFPTIYVLDHNGVIRHKNLRGEELVAAVDELIKRVTAEGTAAAPEPAEKTPGTALVAETGPVTGDSEERSDLRIWTNRDGRTVELKFVRERDGTVTLRRADGREFDLPLEMFTDEDQRWVRERTGGQ